MSPSNVKSIFCHFIPVLLLFLGWGCAKKDLRDVIIDYVIAVRTDKTPNSVEFVERADLYTVDSIRTFPWQIARIYEVKMPADIHHRYCVVGVTPQDSVFVVAAHFAKRSLDWEAVVDPARLNDSISILEFLGLYESILASQCISFNILQSPVGYPKEIQQAFLPLSITRSDSAWEVHFFSRAVTDGMVLNFQEYTRNRMIISSGSRRILHFAEPVPSTIETDKYGSQRQAFSWPPE